MKNIKRTVFITVFLCVAFCTLTFSEARTELPSADSISETEVSDTPVQETNPKEFFDGDKFTVGTASFVVEDGGAALIFVDKSEIELVIPETVTAGSKSLKVFGIKKDALAYAYNLESITLPDTLKYIDEGAFDNCGKLYEINVDEMCKYHHSVDGVLYNKDKTWLYKYPPGKKEQSYTLPKTVEEVRYNAFSGAWSLAEILVEEENPIYKSKDGVLFKTPTSKEIDAGMGDTLVKYPNAKNAESYEIPYDATIVGHNSFSGAASLKDVKISENIDYIGNGAFESCLNLSSVQFLGKPTEISSLAFAGCTNLRSIRIPFGTLKIGELAFAGNIGLVSVYIPESTVEISKDAFFGCRMVTVYSEQGSYAPPFAAENGLGYSSGEMYIPPENREPEPNITLPPLNSSTSSEQNSPSSSNHKILKGDISENGKISSEDIILFKRILSKSDKIQLNLETADINSDGNISGDDIIELKKIFILQ